MDAYQYLETYIVGQQKLKPELSIIMEELKSGRNLNILIRGQSGYGKTYLAKIMCNYIGLEQCRLYLAQESVNIVRTSRVHVLDEAHEIKVPEYLYPMMDSGEYTFIILTNEFDDLKEPFQNRCIQFTLLPYSNVELTTIVNKTLRRHGYILSNEICSVIASYSRGNPRVAKVLSKRLSMLFKRVGVEDIIDNLEESLSIYFNISRGGFTEFDKVYLEFLKNNGTVGIDTLSRMLCIPKQTLQAEVEPFLVRQRLIRLTPRGRVYIGD